MCGIFITTKNYESDIYKDKLARIKHRGPDYTGIVEIDERVTMGHQRLSIIDLDERSNQPFKYKHLWIVFNGEIYNFKTLKNALINKGYDFHTESDTEVIMALYLEYGEDCVNHLNGMFAFVIYNPVNSTLFGARDRLGKKPLYYSLNDGEFEAASQPSEIKVGNKFTVNNDAITQYLQWGYVPEPLSIWNQVQKIEAGYRFSYNIQNKQFSTSAYWELNRNVESYSGTYEQAVEELKVLLEDSVKIRMISDVPLGVFLSGGVDSSLVAALASKQTSKLNTFSVKFNEAEFDESKYASQVAKVIGSNHTVIECNYAEGIDLIKNFDKFYDEPFADSSAIPSMLLSKYTKKNVTVALSGDGGDEAFIGYGRYNDLKRVTNIFKLPYLVRKSVALGLNLSPNYRHKLIASGISQKDIESLYIKLLSVGLNHYWIKDTKISKQLNHLEYLYTNKNIYERVSDFDIKTYLNGDINTKVDRASMAFSLETRAPLMDYRVYEFSRRIPTDFKFKGNNQKRILKDILYSYVPKEIFDRPKSGFTMPFKEWFRKDLKEYVLDELSLNSLKDIPGIHPELALKMINEHMTGSWNRYPAIWSLLVLKQWLKNNS